MIVSTNMVPSKFDAVTVWPFIFIRPASRGDAALLTHETVHYKEQRAWLVIPWLLCYGLSKSFRLNAEVRGYKAQIAVNGISVQQAAKYLVEYGTGITYDAAVLMLTK